MVRPFPHSSQKGDGGRARDAARPRGWVACGLAIALVVCILAGPTPSAWAKKKVKPSRRVTGVVLDADNNPIVGATVELTDKQTGKKLAIYSADEGRYLFADLDPYHDYEIQALSKNLASDVRQVSSLDDRDKIVIILRVPPPKE
ncbi:MAG TPA: carboxypeptidase-like regulatory domain-containing protein [Terriglobia bacterium]|nr:carboxypeptidase-like regulatory domain-containing protein [Terriglobia bacterium]